LYGQVGRSFWRYSSHLMGAVPTFTGMVLG
jgi:hypothetical protein